MSDFDNTNRGALFRNDKQGNEKRPDYKGKLNVGGVDYRISGWLKTSKDGQTKFLSLQAELPEEAPKPAPKAKPVADPAFDDEIPFSFAYWIPAGLLGLMVLGASAGQMVA